MKEIRAIVLLFNGEEPTKSTIRELTLTLKNHCGIPDDENVKASIIDGSKICSLIGKHMADVILGKDSKDEGTCKTPEDNAVFYIGKVMSKYLGENYNPIFFSSELLHKAAKACEDPNKGSNKEFLNALRILNQPTVNVSRTILEEVNMTKEVIELIQELLSRIVILR